MCTAVWKVSCVAVRELYQAPEIRQQQCAQRSASSLQRLLLTVQLYIKGGSDLATLNPSQMVVHWNQEENAEVLKCPFLFVWILSKHISCVTLGNCRIRWITGPKRCIHHCTYTQRKSKLHEKCIYAGGPRFIFWFILSESSLFKTKD